ncbi:hypothetical protein DERF_009788 [Dermatophagoides farinae]|uniref:Uncharacterized protein n=1 Tax=Dermatophagoides farinae TaxID=6954 RepID=A0A922HXL9_DERFA|nr:hypothetical protein DERF_009788 [Dermatophagoides farinae]
MNIKGAAAAAQLLHLIPSGDEDYLAMKNRSICSEEDRLLFEDSLMQSMYRRLNQPIPVSHRSVAAFREIPFNALKHSIITFAFLQAFLQNDHLTVINRNWLTISLANLVRLILRKNQITEIGLLAFDNLRSLRFLDLRHNHLGIFLMVHFGD